MDKLVLKAALGGPSPLTSLVTLVLSELKNAPSDLNWILQSTWCSTQDDLETQQDCPACYQLKKFGSVTAWGAFAHMGNLHICEGVFSQWQIQHLEPDVLPYRQSLFQGWPCFSQKRVLLKSYRLHETQSPTEYVITVSNSYIQCLSSLFM